MSGHAVMVEAHHQRRHGMQRARPKSAKPSEGVMDDWTPEAVRDWLTEVGYPTVGEAALRAGVSGCALPFLGHEGFRELGLESTVERVKVLGLLSKLTSQSGTAETKKESCWQELRRPLPQISADCCRSKPRSAWSRLKQVATKIDSVAWADHKKPWFEHLAMSGRSPDAVREAFMAQLDSYNLLTLLLLATVLPTSVSIGVELKWDADGMPTSRFKLACLVYSVMYSIVIFFHFSLNHITSVLVTDVSTANFQLFLDAFGKDLMADVGIYFLVVYYNFFAWVLLSMAAVIAESAHWTVWAVAFPCGLLPVLFLLFFAANRLGKDDSGQRPRVADCALLNLRPLLRLTLHCGLMSVAPVDMNGVPRDRRSLLEALSQRAMESMQLPSAEPDHAASEAEEVVEQVDKAVL